MYRMMCKSKIHRVTVTEANLNYEGSISIDKKLLAAADILQYEKVQVLNVCNGSRMETYVMEAKAGSGVVCLNGAAARWGQVGDLVESLFKREAGVKDSGKLFPGIGGILDLLDSLLFNAPIMYLYLRHVLVP